jgi:putative SOS response-associated peptidase YedK
MCGRFDLNDHPSVQLLLDYLGVTLSPERFVPRYNVAPTTSVFAVFDQEGPELAEMQWGTMSCPGLCRVMLLFPRFFNQILAAE